jgi:hypothetical protein
MKCEFLVDADTERSMLTPEEAAKTVVRMSRNATTGEMREEAYFPAGTIHEHPECWRLVDFGMAKPADDECERMCKPMSSDERSKLILAYKADSLGIHDAADRELFFAGVIAGYEGLGDGKLAYIPGPNYEAWKVEQDALKKQKASDI